MSLFRDNKSGSWYVEIRHEGIRRRIKSPEDSRRGAQAYEVHLRQRLARGEDTRSLGKRVERADEQALAAEYARSERTYRSFTAEWMQAYVQTNNKPSERSKKHSVLRRHLLPVFGNAALHAIDAALIERYKAAKLKIGLSEKTINNHLSILRASLTYARDRGYVDHLPIVKWLKVLTPVPQFLNKHEMDALLSYGQETVWGVMILLGLRTGMRIGELLGLHWEDVDLETGSITIRRNLSEQELVAPKNNRTRQFPLPQDVAAALARWQRHQGRTGGFVFSTPEGGHLSRYVAHDALQRICGEVGIKRYSWHKLRHTFATHALAQGAPIRDVQHVLGHSTIQMTEKYAHVTDQSLRRTLNLLGGEVVDVGQYMASEKDRACDRALSHAVADAKNALRKRKIPDVGVGDFPLPPRGIEPRFAP